MASEHWLIEPLWVEFATLIGSSDRPAFSPTHPWGCHRRRVPDRVVFDHVIAALAAKVKEPVDLIGSLRAEEETLRAELNRLNLRLKELTASIASAEKDQANYQLILDQLTSGQIPPADPEPGKVPGVRPRQSRARKVTAPARSGGRRSAPVSNAILGLLGDAPDQEWTVKEMQARLPEVGPKVLSNTVLRLHSRGSIDRTRAGHYRLASSIS